MENCSVDFSCRIQFKYENFAMMESSVIRNAKQEDAVSIAAPQYFRKALPSTLK